MNAIVLIAIVIFTVILFIAVIKSRRANPEQSSTEMDPGNFRNPKIERVEKQDDHG